MFLTILTILHLVICIFLIVIVLVQHGKGADIGATFGGAGNTVFGARGAATVLSKITVAAAVLFMVTSMTLAVLATRQSTGSVFSEETPPAGEMPAMGAGPEEGGEEATMEEAPSDEAAATSDEVPAPDESPSTESAAPSDSASDDAPAPEGTDEPTASGGTSSASDEAKE